MLSYVWIRKYFNHVIEDNIHSVIAEMSVEESIKAYDDLYITKEDKDF